MHPIRWIRHGLVLTAALLAVAAAAEDASRPKVASIAEDARLQQRITVRAPNMPLPRLLEQVSAVVKVHLRADGDLANQKVCAFAEDIPAGRVLDALLNMLNMAPEAGYSWQRAGNGDDAGYRLVWSARARAAVRAKLQKDAETAVERLRAALQKIAQDPDERRRAFDPKPIPRAPRRAYLVSLLSPSQLDRLLQDRSFVLRASTATPDQARILRLMAGDLRREMEEELAANPKEEVAGRILGAALDDPTLALEVKNESDSLSIDGYLRLVPGVPGIGISVYPQHDEGDHEPYDATPPPDEGPPLKLRLANGAMWTVLSEVARRSGMPVVSDSYWSSWWRFQAVAPRALNRLRWDVDHYYRFQSRQDDGFLIFRSRDPYARQVRELPPDFPAQLADRIRRDGVTLDLIASLPQCGVDQSAALSDDPQMRSAAGFAAYLALYLRTAEFSRLLPLYSALTPAQRQQVRNGGCDLSWSDLSPEARRAFVAWVRPAQPFQPDDAFPKSTFRLLEEPGQRLQMSWQLGGEQKAREYHLDLLEHDFNGDPLPPRTESPDLIGKTAPRLDLLLPDGRAATLSPATGSPRLVVFRRRWVEPFFGPGAGDGDLRALKAALIRPELAAGVAVIVPDAEPGELGAWAKQLGWEGDLFADRDGKAAAAYRAGSQPRVVRVGPDGLVTEVVDGYEALRDAPWSRWLE